MLRIRTFAFFLAAAIVAAVPATAAQDTQLRAVRGTVGYQLNKDAPFTRVVGSLLLSDDRFAVTRAASNGELVLADSSIVALGENTNIEVSAITQADAAAPTAMQLVAGAIRFDIRHPAGGRSNYVFQTPTSQIAIRGTIGLLSTGPNGDTLACLDCAPGDVTITTKRRAAVVLLTGQSAVISAAGDVTVSATTAALTATFISVGLNEIASAPSPFAPGVDHRAPNPTGAIAGGVLGGAAIGTIVSGSSTSAPPPAPRIVVTPPPTPAPSPTGALTINGHAQHPGFPGAR